MLSYNIDKDSKFLSYKTELHFKLLTRKFLEKLFSQVTNSISQNIKFHFELLTQRLDFYFSILS